MREFITSAKAKEAEVDEDKRDTPFTIDGEEFVARRPGDTKMIVLGTQMTARRSDQAARLGAFMEFGQAVIVAPGWERLTDRLADDEDPFDLEQLSNVFVWLMEEWGGAAG